MAGIKIKAVNQVKFEQRLKSQGTSINRNIVNAVNAIANAIRNDAVISINQNPRAGKTTTRYNPTRTIKISKEGDAPAGDTGSLASQIYVKIDSGGFGASIISNAKYSEALEFGTIKMGARPFMQPSAEQNRKKYKARVIKAIKTGLK